jgi:hypothetical protein
MTTKLYFLLQNYKVEIAATSEEAENQLSTIRPTIHNLTNPREILTLVESIVGIQSTTIKDNNTDEIVLSSGLLEEENE